MDNRTEQYSLWELLESITENLKTKRLADVFRFISFYPVRRMDHISIYVSK